MTRRSLAVRLTLVVAIITTIATSVSDYDLTDVDQRTIGEVPTRISVVANRAAVNHHDHVSLELEILRASGTARATVTITPDDPALAPQMYELGAVPVRVFFGLARCARDHECDTGVTVEIEGTVAEVTATATLSANGDPALLFPKDRSFPADATVEVRFRP